MNKIHTQTGWSGALDANGHIEANVQGRFIEEDVPDIYKSKSCGVIVYKKSVYCQIQVLGSEVKDIVSHEIFDNEIKSQMLKKRFAAAWDFFERNRGVIISDSGKAIAPAAAPQQTRELKEKIAQLEQEIARQKAQEPPIERQKAQEAPIETQVSKRKRARH